MARRGLNCTLVYRAPGVNRAYRLRVNKITYGFEMIATESQAKDSRAYYPRRTAPTQFAINAMIIGPRERVSLNRYMMGYATAMLDADTSGKQLPMMTVSLPSRNFRREGVLISGWEWGTRTGEMVWNHNLGFETSREPIDWDQKVVVSRVQGILAGLKDPASKYYYPTGEQLSGSQGAALAAAVTGSADLPVYVGDINDAAGD